MLGWSPGLCLGCLPRGRAPVCLAAVGGSVWQHRIFLYPGEGASARRVKRLAPRCVRLFGLPDHVDSKRRAPGSYREWGLHRPGEGVDEAMTTARTGTGLCGTGYCSTGHRGTGHCGTGGCHTGGPGTWWWGGVSCIKWGRGVFLYNLAARCFLYKFITGWRGHCS